MDEEESVLKNPSEKYGNNGIGLNVHILGNLIGISPAVSGVGRVEFPTVVGAKKREYG